MPSHLPTSVRRRLEPIRLLILDVDGVLTDGSLLYSAAGEELKRFNVRDGLVIRLMIEAGIQVALLTGRTSGAVEQRARELGIREDLVIQGSRDKLADLMKLQELAGVNSEQVAAMGDDIPDLPVLGRVGFSACPADAAPEVIAICHHVCRQSGGQGAVREIGELLLKGQRLWIKQVERWLKTDSDSDD
jgi:3-deoxy-D-manno-octulosonate 8-phosphate phosphatase (KDO 8-P phosphatase)